MNKLSTADVVDRVTAPEGDIVALPFPEDSYVLVAGHNPTDAV